jgi:hypothetical protein
MKTVAARKNEYAKQINRLVMDGAGQKDMANRKIEGLVKQVSTHWKVFLYC